MTKSIFRIACGAAGAFVLVAVAGCTLYFDGDDEPNPSPPPHPTPNPYPVDAADPVIVVDAAYFPDAAAVTCAGYATCDQAAPTCPAGSTPTLVDGCYTGYCQVIAYCDAPPICEELSHESDCLARQADCAPEYTGTGCHKPDGSACHAGDTNCQCTNYTFARCSHL